jgi:Spy/CpxP family protein refolding chaperone
MSTPQPELASAAPCGRLAGQARIEELEYELSLSRELRRRLEEERRRLDAHLAAAESDRAHLLSVLAQREAYVAAIHRSVVWKAAQALRRLAGRTW